MKKLIFITILLILVKNVHAQQTVIPPALVNELLKTVINDPKNILGERKPKIQNIIDCFIPWDTRTFEFPKERLPKTTEERKKMLEAEEEPYNEFYLYSPFFTDSIFTDGDRISMLAQSKNANEYRKFSYRAQNIRLVKDTIQVKDTLKIGKVQVRYFGYTYPVFSKDLNYAVIRRNEYSLLIWNDDFKTGRYALDGFQTIYYKKIPGKGWRLIFLSGLVIMS